MALNLTKKSHRIGTCNKALLSDKFPLSSKFAAERGVKFFRNKAWMKK